MRKTFAMFAALVALGVGPAGAEYKQAALMKAEVPNAASSSFIEIKERFGVHDAWLSDAEGFSAAAQERITGSALYFEVYLERPDGSVDPAYHGTSWRGAFLFTTAGGRNVLRLIELPALIESGAVPDARTTN